MPEVILDAAVILHDNEDMQAIAELLFGSVSRKIYTTRYYNHANELEMSRNHDLLLVHRLESLAEIVIVYRRQGIAVPPIIHLVNPEVLAYCNYEARFPGVEVYPIEQASLDEQDVTLRFDAFSKAVHAIYHHKEQLVNAAVQV